MKQINIHSDKYLLDSFKDDEEQQYLFNLIENCLGEDTDMSFITIHLCLIFLKNMFKISKSKNLKKYIFTMLVKKIQVIIQSIEKYDLDQQGLSKIAFFLEEEFHFERKKNFELLINSHEICIFFGVSNSQEYQTSGLNTLCEIKKQKSQFQRERINIFLLNNIEKFIEKVIYRNSPLFSNFHLKFYKNYPIQQYKSDENYDMKGMEFFNIQIKQKNIGILKSFLHIGDSNLLIVQKSKNIQKWAHVLLNIKYKLFRATMLGKSKICLVMFTHQRDLNIYFSDSKKAQLVFSMINNNKKNILLNELTQFSERLQVLKGLLQKKII